MTEQDSPLTTNYTIGRILGKGNKGTVRSGTNKITGKEIAIKLAPSLEYESKVCYSLKGGHGITSIEWYGKYDEECDALVMDLLGHNLEDLFNVYNRKFSLMTVLMLADQLITRIQYVHFKKYIHRSIKPENLAIGLEKDRNTIFMIDFGSAKRYEDPQTNKHIPMMKGDLKTGILQV